MHPAPSRPVPRGAWVRLALWALLAVALVPSLGSALAPGLDPSYGWGINALRTLDLSHGRDVVFPYGPLGFLLLPAEVDGTLAGAVAGRFLLHLLFAAVLARQMWSATTAQAAGCAALLLLAEVLGLPFDGRLLLLLGLVLAPLWERPSGVEANRAAVCAAFLAVGFALIKVSLGITALALLGTALLPALWRPARLRAAMVGLGALAVAAALALTLLGGFRSALLWISGQVELARGFGGAMSLAGPPEELAAGLLCLALPAVLAVRAARRRSPWAGFWAAHLLPLWAVWKHGFVRQDGHVVLFFTYLLGVLAVGLLLAGRPGASGGTAGPDLAVAGAALAVLALGAVPAALAHPPATAPFAVATGLQGVTRLRQLVHFSGLQQNLARRGARDLAPLRLPEPLAAPLRSGETGVDALPWDLALLPANGLRWVPNPVLQLYGAYTRPLDQRAARHFAGSRAPDVVLATFAALEQRHLLWDTPATWQAVLAAYEPAWELPERDLLALRRRPVPRAWSWRPLGRRAARPGEWIPVPATGGYLFADVEVEPTPVARLTALAFRPAPVRLEVAFADGRTRRWRVLTDTAPGGLLVAPLPPRAERFAALWQGEGPRAVRLRCLGSEVREVSVRFRQGRLEAPIAPAPGLRGAPSAPPRPPAGRPPGSSPCLLFLVGSHIRRLGKARQKVEQPRGIALRRLGIRERRLRLAWWSLRGCPAKVGKDLGRDISKRRPQVLPHHPFLACERQAP
jgi:hypothetical protein